MKSVDRSPLEIDISEFKAIGHQLVDQIAEFLSGIGDVPITAGKTSEELKEVLGNSTLTENGLTAEKILTDGMHLLTEYSLFNGHPKFMGYITGAASPISALADFIASAINPNVGAQTLSPIATEIERLTIRWLLELIGLPQHYGGILVSGGNMANLNCFFTALKSKLPANYHTVGLAGIEPRVLVYCCQTTHTWIEKAVKISGLGIESLRYVVPDNSNGIDCNRLNELIKQDRKKGYLPIMVVGSAGDVSTGAVDDIKKLSEICKENDLWFHLDGAYGLPAAAIPGMKSLFEGLNEADSLALDPHKWLYNALEVGCALVKDPNDLLKTYSSKPEYYHFEDDASYNHNFYEHGLQNSRGFRAFKLWATLQQAGKQGLIDMIDANIQQAKMLYQEAELHPELQAVSHNLSITNFIYAPPEVDSNTIDGREYLNQLNQELLVSLQKSGEVFLSNAIIDGRYCLRSCIVNFRTTTKDIIEIISIVIRQGRLKHRELVRDT